ncbi:MAG: CPBP family intramembrane metalloprotease [bacterium]|nr:CPBP family intramembrane metalloprotease [bacterium]
MIPFARVLTALLLGAAIAILTIRAPFWLGTAQGTALPNSLVTHTLMLTISLLSIAYLSNGKFKTYGFSLGSYRFKPTILLWLIPTGILSLLQFVASRMGVPHQNPFDYTVLQTILLIWIYASICEEVFVRGLLQGYLSPLQKYKVTLFKKWPLSLPVILGALFFGSMHIVLWTKIGRRALVPMVLATLLGVVVGYYREKTGSLVPAVMIHAMFNIGGSLPFWILSALIH